MGQIYFVTMCCVGVTAVGVVGAAENVSEHTSPVTAFPANLHDMIGNV
jgi:hypothetical protein